jgi:amino acid permease
MSESKHTEKDIQMYGATGDSDTIVKHIGDRESGGSTWAAFINYVCILAGTGTLGLPKAVSTGGWLSLIFVVLGGTLAQYNAQLLIECLYSQPNGRLEGFAEVGQASFGKAGKWIVQILCFGMCLGISCIYIILVGSNIDELAKYYGFHLSLKIWITISGVIIGIPYVLVKTLKEATSLGIFGALCTFVVVIICVARALMDYPHQLELKETMDYQVINWSGIPIALTTIAFSFGANATLPHLESAMARPRNFAKATASSITVVGVAYMLICIVCYLVYTHEVQSPVYQSIPKDAYYVASLVIITLHVIMACPMFLCSFSLDLEHICKISTEYMTPNKERIVRIFSRVLVCVVITVISLVLPFFESFMNLVGAITNGVLVFIIPPLCHIKLFGFKKRPWYSYIFIAISLVIGVVCAILGTIDAVKGLIANFKGETPASSGH